MNNGRTLLELLLGLASLSILGLISITKLGETPLKRYAREITAFLNEMELRVRREGNTINLRRVNDNKLTAFSNEYLVRELPLHRLDSLSISSSRGATLYFYPDGIASPGKIEITRGRRWCAIVLSLRGRIRTVCD